ncbi:MAG: hypothetical protein PsegKO_30410 [Pseudohongiellaceae bacterium]
MVEQYLPSEQCPNLVYVSESYDSLAMLQRGRIDLIPYNQIAMEELMSESTSARELLLPMIELEEVSTAHSLVISKSPNPALVAQLTAAFQALVDSGKHAEIPGASLPGQ